MKKDQKANAARDRTWAEFLEQYEDHINGRVSPGLRIGDRPGPDDDDGPVKGTIEKDADYEAERKSKLSSIASKHSDRRSAGSKLMSPTGNENAKYDLPKNCKLNLSKKLTVHAFESDYLLAASPYPQIEGEMLLFQQVQENPGNEEGEKPKEKEASDHI